MQRTELALPFRVKCKASWRKPLPVLNLEERRTTMAEKKVKQEAEKGLRQGRAHRRRRVNSFARRCIT